MTNWRTIIIRKFSHCCEGTSPISDFSAWGSGKGTMTHQGI